MGHAAETERVFPHAYTFRDGAMYPGDATRPGCGSRRNAGRNVSLTSAPTCPSPGCRMGRSIVGSIEARAIGGCISCRDGLETMLSMGRSPPVERSLHRAGDRRPRDLRGFPIPAFRHHGQRIGHGAIEQTPAAPSAPPPRRRPAGRCSSTATRSTAGAATKKPTRPARGGRSRMGCSASIQGTAKTRAASGHRHHGDLRSVRADVGMARRGGRQQRPEVLRARGHGLGDRPRVSADRRRAPSRREDRAAPSDGGALRRAACRQNRPLKPAGQFNQSRVVANGKTSSTT